MASYRVLHASEVDEPVHEDCLPCSIFMLAQAATEGEGTSRLSTGREIGRRAIKRIREQMRNKVPDQDGGMPHALGRRMLLAQWPNIPWDDKLTSKPIPFEQFWDEVRRGVRVANVMGNPSEVKKPESTLRKWTINDNFGHSIFWGAATADKALLYDPLAPYPSDPDANRPGAWVPKADLKQFLWLKDGVVLWHWSIAPGSMTQREIIRRSKNATIREVSGDLAEERRDRREAERLAEDLGLELATVQGELAACQAQGGIDTDQVRAKFDLIQKTSAEGLALLP